MNVCSPLRPRPGWRSGRDGEARAAWARWVIAPLAALGFAMALLTSATGSGTHRSGPRPADAAGNVDQSTYPPVLADRVTSTVRAAMPSRNPAVAVAAAVLPGALLLLAGGDAISRHPRSRGQSARLGAGRTPGRGPPGATVFGWSAR